MEILCPPASGARFEHAVLDFDGTISLIREGWQAVMTGYFVEVMMEAPGAAEHEPESIERLVREFITLHTGKQTIYQCIALAEEVARLRGRPLDPQAYKDEYHRRLLERIDGRLTGLEDGSLRPEDFVVPGSYQMLDMLRGQGLTLCLASGTDEHYVLHEAALLGVDRYFGGHIYGAQRDYRTFSKKMVIDRILRENAVQGQKLLGFGDGYVEIENIAQAGGYAVGVASNEAERQGIDAWKRERLIRAGAHLIIPDYRDLAPLEQLLFGAGA